jgi:hypothetical protein
VSAVHGETKSGEVNIIVELYDGTEPPPTFTNDVASVEPVHTFHAYGDVATFYYQLKSLFDLLDGVRSR